MLPKTARLPKRGPVSQSAMEYLMTYGWAILIIAVVLGALYSLGVFNAVNFMPKVPGGGCHVFRPNGPGTSWNVNLVGSCNNALPQYVAQFNGKSYTNIPYSSYLAAPSPLTVSLWVNHFDLQNSVVIERGAYTGSYSIQFYYTGGSSQLRITENTINWFFVVSGWNNVVFTVDSNGTSTAYVNGVQKQAAANVPLGSNSGRIVIGGDTYDNPTFNGSIANVQVYNTSLTANQVQYLYNEGIGGVPVSPQYLVGWWPLNGDTNDYSGNNNNGVPTNVIFNGTWTSGYNVP